MKKVVYNYEALGASMHALRKSAKISIDEICAGCGISRRTYYQVIIGETLE